MSLDDLDTTIDFQYGSFHNNRAGFGGALAISIGDTRPHPIFTGSALSFKNNSSTQNGGAVYSHGAQFQLTRGIFLENKPATGGTLSVSGSPFLLANLLIARNSGAAGIEASIDGQLINSTIADNDGVGLLLNAQLRATNTVVSNNRKQNCQFAGSAAAAFVDGRSNYQFPGRAVHQQYRHTTRCSTTSMFPIRRARCKAQARTRSAWRRQFLHVTSTAKGGPARCSVPLALLRGTSRSSSIILMMLAPLFPLQEVQDRSSESVAVARAPLYATRFIGCCSSFSYWCS